MDFSLKNAFNSGYLTYVRKIKTSDWKHYKKAETFDELKEDKFGVLLKNTGTIYSDKRLDIQEEHKRNLKNKTLSKEDEDELDYAVELMENPFAFENYCGACDNFGTDNCFFKNKVNNMTEWKIIKCNNFYD